MHVAIIGEAGALSKLDSDPRLKLVVRLPGTSIHHTRYVHTNLVCVVICCPLVFRTGMIVSPRLRRGAVLLLA